MENSFKELAEKLEGLSDISQILTGMTDGLKNDMSDEQKAEFEKQISESGLNDLPEKLKKAKQDLLNLQSKI